MRVDCHWRDVLTEIDGGECDWRDVLTEIDREERRNVTCVYKALYFFQSIQT